MLSSLTIGLFGTCGTSRWRDRFIEAYTRLGIAYYNPQIDHWQPEFAQEEAQHLAQDGVIVFPITEETPGLGSLAETGFSLLQALRSAQARFFVVYVADTPDPTQMDPAVFGESCRARALVRAHLFAHPMPNVFVCDSLDQVLAVSLDVYRALQALHQARTHLLPKQDPS